MLMEPIGLIPEAALVAQCLIQQRIISQDLSVHLSESKTLSEWILLITSLGGEVRRPGRFALPDDVFLGLPPTAHPLSGPHCGPTEDLLHGPHSHSVKLCRCPIV